MPGKKPIERRGRQGPKEMQVASMKKRRVLDFASKVNSLNIAEAKMRKEKRAVLHAFLKNKGINLEECRRLSLDYVKFLNDFSMKASGVTPFNALSRNEQATALRKMNAFVKALGEAKKAGLA